jgi:hypothetical protein
MVNAVVRSDNRIQGEREKDNMRGGEVAAKQ